MFETDLDQKERERREDLARLRGLRPIDDDFMRCLFRDNIPLAQMVLRILTDKPDLEITRIETQKDLKRLAGARSICLDAYGTDSTGKKYDLEIQRSDYGAGQHRARYHASCLNVENLNASQKFEELPDVYVIFITEHDLYHMGLPCYRIERMNLDTSTTFGDGEHILYVNGAYRGDSAIGQLMHDFSCYQAEDMLLPLMRERTRYFKETQEGVESMCRVMEEMRNEALQRGIQQERLSSIRNVMETLHTGAEQAMDILKIPQSERSQYASAI